MARWWCMRDPCNNRHHQPSCLRRASCLSRAGVPRNENRRCVSMWRVESGEDQSGCLGGRERRGGVKRRSQRKGLNGKNPEAKHRGTQAQRNDRTWNLLMIDEKIICCVKIKQLNFDASSNSDSRKTSRFFVLWSK